MNIRFSAGAVRCRVARAEIDELLRADALELRVALPRNHHFQVTVRAAALGGWQLESDPTGLWISIPRGEIEQLTQALPSREGIAHSFDVGDGEQLEVSFEVDVRKRQRSVKSRELGDGSRESE